MDMPGDLEVHDAVNLDWMAGDAGYITLAKWARGHGKSASVARRHAKAGRLDKAIFVLGRWLVHRDTPWPEGLPEGAAAHRKKR